MATIELRGIRKTYPGGREVTRGIDLTIQEGDFMVFVGPSGCGKSTMLRMIAGLESVTEGDLLVDGLRVNEVPPSNRGGAMVFQNYALYPHMTVERNMGFALEVAGAKKSEIRAAVGKAAEILNISHMLQAYPKALSGGERQRVAIGRAIVRKPKFFLFDEPLSNLDAALRVQLRIELLRLHSELKTTMIYVTHDQVEAMVMGTRIALFHDGQLEQVGPPLTLYHQPRNTFVAGFLGSPTINILPCVAGDNGTLKITEDLSLVIPSGRSAACSEYGRVASIGIRPEDCRIKPRAVGQSPGPGCLSGHVVLIENLGDHAIVHVQVPGIEALLTAKCSAADLRIEKGQSICFEPVMDKAMLFDASSVNLDASHS
jgi:multiple sugar transport system ATP-binding protein